MFPASAKPKQSVQFFPGDRIVSSVSENGGQRLTVTVWLILGIAAIGFAFDIYELLMLPLILRPALTELLPNVAPGSDEFNLWRALMFWLPAMAGGVFGLLGGYLTDRLGRRRVLTWSILLYAVSAFLAGFSTSMPMLLILRCTTFIGVCVEFVAAVAWLAELFPNPEQRERALGYTQAFSSIGGLMVGVAFLLATEWRLSLPAIVMPEFLSGLLGQIAGEHAAWRYTLMSGLIPALPLIIIRPFLPESPIWQRKKDAGTLKRPSFVELFSPRFRRTTVITTIMVACSYGAAFGAIQQLPQIVPGLPEVRAEMAAVLVDNESKLQPLSKADRTKAEKRLTDPIRDQTAGQMSLAQEVGGLLGRFLLALLVVRIFSRRALLRVFLVPGLIVMPLVFAFLTINNQVLFTVADWRITLVHIGIFLAGLLTVAQFSFWGNYLPTVYPVHLRGTGESVAANIGGRMIGTSFAAVTSLGSGLAFIPGSDDPTRIAYTAAAVGFVVYFINFVASFFLPETREETLRE
jgi:MFS family permease